MGASLILLCVLAAVVLAAIAGRALHRAWRAWRIARERRAGEERRKKSTQVPVERRKDHRRR